MLLATGLGTRTFYYYSTQSKKNTIRRITATTTITKPQVPQSEPSLLPGRWLHIWNIVLEQFWRWWGREWREGRGGGEGPGLQVKKDCIFKSNYKKLQLQQELWPLQWQQRPTWPTHWRSLQLPGDSGCSFQSCEKKSSTIICDLIWQFVTLSAL